MTTAVLLLTLMLPIGAAAAARTYHIDPVKGGDTQAGDRADRAWKSLAKVNALRLAPGDTVVIAPGNHAETLQPVGEGTSQRPIVIRFLAGTHAFGSTGLLRRPYFVSNSCDKPTHPLPIGILVEKARHLRLQGDPAPGSTRLVMAGPERSTYFVNDQAEDIEYSHLTFDLQRPTVSEYRVVAVAENSADIQVAEGSTYAVREGRFAWTGDIGSGWTMVQQANPAEGRSWRLGQWDPFTSARAEELAPGRVRLTYAKGRLGMEVGAQYQFRCVDRDVVSAHNTRCRGIALRDCDFQALTGMAIVSQFCDGLTYQRVRVAPPAGTLRTCPAWADIFHFSGCRGQILVEQCVFSGSQDDPINIHGTHLRIIGQPAANQFLLRFMQPQTYGFAAFAPGDEVAVISHASLRELPGNPRRKVAAVERRTDHEWLVTLDGPAPAFGADDVLDNVSWYPDATIRGCRVDMDSCRGFLVTTRGRVVIEDNVFNRCAMAGLLVEDDAEGWFESGPVRDMLIRGNQFIRCGIELNPHNANNDPLQPVHENIRIENNRFAEGAHISAKGVRGLTITGNHADQGHVNVQVAPSCSEVKLDAND